MYIAFEPKKNSVHVRTADTSLSQTKRVAKLTNAEAAALLQHLTMSDQGPTLPKWPEHLKALRDITPKENPAMRKALAKITQQHSHN
jgi:hypothetical protein